jgi:hypothetical protein
MALISSAGYMRIPCHESKGDLRDRPPPLAEGYAKHRWFRTIYAALANTVQKRREAMSTSKAAEHWSQWIALATAFLISTGCDKRSMKLAGADGSIQDLASAADRSSMQAAETATADSLQPDVFSIGPDVAPGEDVKATDSTVKDEDSAGGPVLAGRDGPVTAGDGSFLLELPAEMPSSPDALIPVDLQAEAGTDASQIPSDITLFKNKDFGVADQACIEGTALWLDRIATYLDEDRKCWNDEDCWIRLPEFQDPCGLICTFPINHQREYEFTRKVNEYAKEVCASCPHPESYPDCPPTGDYWCNAGRCEYR